jgi:hypothetical protein
MKRDWQLVPASNASPVLFTPFPDAIYLEERGAMELSHPLRSLWYVPAVLLLGADGLRERAHAWYDGAVARNKYGQGLR